MPPKSNKKVRSIRMSKKTDETVNFISRALNTCSSRVIDRALDVGLNLLRKNLCDDVNDIDELWKQTVDNLSRGNGDDVKKAVLTALDERLDELKMIGLASVYATCFLDRSMMKVLAGDTSKSVELFLSNSSTQLSELFIEVGAGALGHSYRAAESFCIAALHGQVDFEAAGYDTLEQYTSEILAGEKTIAMRREEGGFHLRDAKSISSAFRDCSTRFNYETSSSDEMLVP